MTKTDFTRLPQAELEIMLIIWEAGDTVSSTYILEKFKLKREWALPTLMTVLTRLVNKGFVKCTKEGRNNRYSAQIDGDEYKAMYMSSLIDDMYSGSFDIMIKSLIDGNVITAQNIKDIAQKF